MAWRTSSLSVCAPPVLDGIVDVAIAQCSVSWCRVSSSTGEKQLRKLEARELSASVFYIDKCMAIMQAAMFFNSTNQVWCRLGVALVLLFFFSFVFLILSIALSAAPSRGQAH